MTSMIPKVQRKKNRTINVTEEEAARIYNDRMNGKTFREIHLSTGRSISGISKICKNYEDRKRLIEKGYSSSNLRKIFYKTIREKIQAKIMDSLNQTQGVTQAEQNFAEDQREGGLGRINSMVNPVNQRMKISTSTTTANNSQKDDKESSNFLAFDFDIVLKSSDISCGRINVTFDDKLFSLPSKNPLSQASNKINTCNNNNNNNNDNNIDIKEVDKKEITICESTKTQQSNRE